MHLLTVSQPVVATFAEHLICKHKLVKTIMSTVIITDKN